MREFYERCTIIYDDYRTAIPSYAAAALSFYLLLLLIPAFTLIAIGTSLFNIDMTILQNIIEQFVVKEYAQMLIDILQSRSFNTVAFVTILVSSYAGIRHILLYALICFCLPGIYMIVPRMKIHYSDAFQGALVASVLLLILYYALSFYFQIADYQSVYGPLASIVIVLFVFNWTAEFFYVGMYITNILYFRRISDEKRKSRNKEIGN